MNFANVKVMQTGVTVLTCQSIIAVHECGEIGFDKSHGTFVPLTRLSLQVSQTSFQIIKTENTKSIHEMYCKRSFGRLSQHLHHCLDTDEASVARALKGTGQNFHPEGGGCSNH